MDEILLYLCFKYFGEWMAVYDSLQRKEELKVYDIKKAVNEVDADWITLISSDYPKNLKSIYKPPFGVLLYGKTKLLHQNIVTIVGDPNESNQSFLDHLRSNDIALLWPKKSNSAISLILDRYPKNNIFYLSELKNKDDKTFQKFINDENIILNNNFMSEIWSRNNNVDYSNQKEERMYLGLSLQLLMVSNIPHKQLLAVANYCELENINVGILESAYTKEVAKAFSRCKVNVIKNLADLSRLYFERS